MDCGYSDNRRFVEVTIREEKMNGRTLNSLASRVDKFAESYSVYEYYDSGANYNYFRETLQKSPEIIIEWLLEIVEEELV